MSGESPEERAHWRDVLRAFDGYMQYHLSANHARRMSFLALPRESRDVLETLGYRDKLEAVDEGIRRNAEFIDEMIADPVFASMMQDDDTPGGGNGDGHGHGHGHGHSHGHEDAHAHSHSHAHGQSNADADGHAHTHASPSGSSTPANRGDRGDRAERHAAQDKVRSTLRSFVRDWSAAGAGERERCYAPCLDALERYFPALANEDEKGVDVAQPGRRKRNRGDVRVLVPGCGLGRLAMEIAARGFESQGNEFSSYMLLASNWVLNQTTHANSHTIHPYLHSFSNHLSTPNLLRGVGVPDVCPADVLGGGAGGAFSLVAGEFVEVYGAHLLPRPKAEAANGADKVEDPGVEGQSHEGRWGAVVTCFFIDCARNVLTFLRLIHSLMEEDGVWINIGPLLWHFENSPGSSGGGEGHGSVELSLDEVKELARVVGFDLHEEKMVQTTYTGMPDSMLKNEYNAAFWVATKRSE